jgi:hypothetical protein
MPQTFVLYRSFALGNRQMLTTSAITSCACAGRLATIESFADEHGYAVADILRYQAAGLLQPTRDEHGHALYGERECLRLEVIAKGKRLGFSTD